MAPSQLLSRAWLLDPVHTQITALRRPSARVNRGTADSTAPSAKAQTAPGRTQFSTVLSAEAELHVYTKTLQMLNNGDRVWVKIPDVGFVGVGRATGRAQPAASFKVPTTVGDVPVLEAAKRASYHSEFLNDPERCEYSYPSAGCKTCRWRQYMRLASSAIRTPSANPPRRNGVSQ